MNIILKRGLSFLIAIIVVCSCSFAAFGGDYFVVDNIDDRQRVSVILPDTLPVGKYTLRYENSGNVVSDFAEICTLEVDGSSNEVVYDDFIAENNAPLDATSIGVYDETNQKVADIDLGDLKVSSLGSKLYSFAAFSDVHIGSKTAEADFQNALEYVEGNSDIEFVTICGDFIHIADNKAQLEQYKYLVDTYTTKPVYAISGNHEAGSNNLGMDDLKPYTNQDLYYSFNHGDDVFIMLGISGCAKGTLFTDAQLQWLHDTLEKNKDKRCFVFQHVRPNKGCGNPWGIYDSNIWGGTEAQVFESLLEHYHNVMFFHGHSHMEFGLQTKDNYANYDNVFGCHSVHIPSLSRPRTGDEQGPASRKELTDESQGYVVEVYENGVLLKGRDFISGKFLPIASYSLDTTIKNVEADTYYDPSGTVINCNSNILKPGSSWYEGSLSKSEITEISFVDSYIATSDENWNASISDTGNVTVYRKGTKLFIVGDKNGVVANKNCNEMFAGFTNLTSINGLENLNKTNISTIEGMFKNCSSLVSLDFSSFKDVKPINMSNVFFGCKSIKEIDLSYFDLTGVKQYLNVFNNCKDLESVTFGDVYDGNVYMSGSFKGCTSIESVDLSGFGTGINLGQTFSGCTSLKTVAFPDSFNVLAINLCFLGCVSLETLDISSFDVSPLSQMNSIFKDCVSLESLVLPSVWDTSNVTTMYNMFYNCPKLTLDCSAWDTTSLIDMTAFKVDSPDVVAPPHAEKTEIKEPTCTEQGYTIHSCSVCGYEYKDTYVAALGHTVVIDEAVIPTCETTGKTEGSHCSVCNTVLEEQINIPATGHTEERDAAVVPTCETAGKTEGSHCSVCNKVIKAQITISATGHKASEWIIDKKETCTTNGSKHKKCTVCYKVLETETIPAIGHTVVTDVAVAPTCETAGKTEGSHCSVCNMIFEKQEIIPAIGHTEVIDAAITPTCTTEGKTEGSHCIVCNKIIKKQIIEPALGHTSNKWVIDENATCTLNGKKHKECTICGESFGITQIPAKGHTEVKDVGREPTCSTVGKTEGSHCSVCNTVLVAQKTIPAKEHVHSEWLVDKEATVNSPGMKYKECTDCGEILQTEIIKQLICSAPKLTKVQNSVSGVKVTWDKTNGADKYRVYRKVKGGSWERVGDTTVTSMIDKKPKTGVTYYYTVKAFNEAGAGSYNKTGLSILHITTPTLKKIENATASVKITWSKVENADGYVLYRKSLGEKSWERIAVIKNGSTTSYKDTKVVSGNSYSYTIKAYDGRTYSSFYANGISIKFLATPSLKSVTRAESGVTLKWGKVTGAGGYIVYRKTGSGSWQRMAVVKGGSTVSYLDKTAKKGVTYTYTVKAYYGKTTSYYNTKGLTIKNEC